MFSCRFDIEKHNRVQTERREKRFENIIVNKLPQLEKVAKMNLYFFFLTGFRLCLKYKFIYEYANVFILAIYNIKPIHLYVKTKDTKAN